ncbi:hypothetical protein H4Q26_011845 [Puccinia striiformis f. sp. tritici PST-130]|nr:hypothetical protein H4Q26_011845 [Puccinia striiformis f. sp. tritici PST-130]
MPLGPNTPATLIILAGSILLVLSTISNPIIKSFYFLSIKVTSKVASIPLDGDIRLGTFGYCFELGSQLACTKPKLGYNLHTDSLGIPLPTQLDLTPSTQSSQHSPMHSSYIQSLLVSRSSQQSLASSPTFVNILACVTPPVSLPWPQLLLSWPLFLTSLPSVLPRID